jgi:outer membrane protein assembly factor BamB
MKIMINLRLFEDNWQGVSSQDTEYPCESPEQVPEALSKLNGKNKTIVALIVDDDHHLTVGGGNDGRYVCYITTGNTILNLKNPAAGKGTPRVRIVAGGQAGDFPADLCVDLSQVRSAAEYYLENGQSNPALVWEPAS